MYIERSPRPARPARVSVFVDGDNIPSHQAEVIRAIARRAGTPDFFRIYGNDRADPGWRQVPGMRMILAGAGKNAADLLLTVEAMDRALTSGMETVLLATSDGDFSHLAMYLKERGHHVIGVGCAKAPAAFRAACSEFEIIVERKPARPVLSELDQKIHGLIAEGGHVSDGMTIALFGGRMHHQHSIPLSKLAEASWRAYFEARPELYDIDPKGTEARVRIRCRADACVQVPI